LRFISLALGMGGIIRLPDAGASIALAYPFRWRLTNASVGNGFGSLTPAHPLRRRWKGAEMAP